MARKSNREIEKYYFEKFMKAYPLPSGYITSYGDKPDVILKGSRHIGIEITNFFLEDGSLPESEQRQQRVREYVIKEAEKIYMADKRKPISMWFIFNNDNPIINKQNLIDNIVELGKRNEMAEAGQISKNLFSGIPELSFVSVDTNSYDDPKWRIMQTGTTPMMLKEELAKIVIRKEEDAKGYQNCDSYWLLIVVDFINSAQDQEIRVEGIDTIKSTIFERIIVYKTGYDHIVEIKGS